MALGKGTSLYSAAMASALIMFDYDGVIVDSLAAFRAALAAACAPIRPGMMERDDEFLGLFDDNMYEGLVRAGVPKDRLPALVQRLADRLAAVNDSLRLFDGARDMLQTLAADHAVYIITSNVSHVVEAVLSREGIVVRDVLGADKGAGKVAKIQATIARHAGLDAYYVGDTLGDMIEGRAAGARTIAAAWGWHDERRLLQGQPDAVARSPRELTSYFTTKDTKDTKR